jgi:hypothetical protein
MIVGPDGRVGPWPGHAWPHRTVIFARVCAFQLVTRKNFVKKEKGFLSKGRNMLI